MGESRTAQAVLRAAGVAGVGVAVTATLTSCALFAPTAPTPSPSASSSRVVVDPSIPSETPIPTVTPIEAEPSASAEPSAPASASPSPSAAPVDARKRVVPFITSAEWDAKAKQLDVSGIVPEVLERDGTCTVTATLGGTTRTLSAKGVAASSYTGCETVAFDGLGAGTWRVRIAYSSGTSAGTSAVRTVTVA